MKDLHNHIIYGIDDGAKDYQRSLNLLKNLESSGVREIVLTPHYIIGSNYNSNNKIKKEILTDLQKKTNIKLYLGNEVYIDDLIIEYIKNGEISTINNSNYLLVELPLSEKLECSKDILFQLRNNGIIPIIAHPERYHYIDLKELVTYVEMGCLLQGNITSLGKKYGKKAQKNLELLLRKNMIHVLGTDIHNSKIENLDKLIDKLTKLVGVKQADALLNDNFTKIVNNKNVEIKKVKKVNKIFKEKIK